MKHASSLLAVLLLACAGQPTPAPRGLDVVDRCGEVIGLAGNLFPTDRYSFVTEHCVVPLVREPTCREALIGSLQIDASSRNQLVAKACTKAYCPRMRAPKAKLCSEDLASLSPAEMQPLGLEMFSRVRQLELTPVEAQRWTDSVGVEPTVADATPPKVEPPPPKKVEPPPPKKVEPPPPKKVEPPPPKKVEPPPPKKVEPPPPKKVEPPPPKKVEPPPPKKVEPPPPKVEPPKKVEPPPKVEPKKVEPKVEPPKKVEPPPPKKVEPPPPKKVEPPPPKVEPPKKVEPPPKKVEPPKKAEPPPKKVVEPPTKVEPKKGDPKVVIPSAGAVKVKLTVRNRKLVITIGDETWDLPEKPASYEFDPPADLVAKLASRGQQVVIEVGNDIQYHHLVGMLNALGMRGIKGIAIASIDE